MGSTGRDLVVVGVSGAGRRVIDVALDVIESGVWLPFSRVLAVDDAPTDENLERLRHMGIEFVGGVRDYVESATPAYFSIGIGAVEAREGVADTFIRRAHEPATLVAPTARVSRFAEVGEGSVISPGAEISTNVRIGRFVHVMANAVVSHDSVVGDFSNVNPSTAVAGNCVLGEKVWLGIGAVTLQGMSIGDRAVVGASACVTRDVASDGVVSGVPARPHRPRS